VTCSAVGNTFCAQQRVLPSYDEAAGKSLFFNPLFEHHLKKIHCFLPKKRCFLKKKMQTGEKQETTHV
jgi:hypothetical protein